MKQILLIILMGSLWLTTLVNAQAEREVLIIDVTGPVTPIMLSVINRTIDQAEASQAEALIIRLDTPGGSIDLTKQIMQTIIAADVPVVVYVWPSGGFAASAGTFITLSGHVAAMAPNTSIGAASPVNGEGGDIGETMKAKIENILTAEMRGLAERRGKKARDWAETTITKAKAAHADEALKLGVIDFVAKDVSDLLTQMDGFKVKVKDKDIILHTAKAQEIYLQQTWIEELLNIIANPAIALMLISIGSLAIAYEFINPGGYMSGVIGLICLLTGFYAIGQLPVNYAGLALILLAFILFGAELFTPTHGALTAGGVVSFILGGLIMFNTDEFAYDVPYATIIGIPMSMAVIFTFGLTKIIQSRYIPVTTGKEGLLQATGIVRTELNPHGIVFIWGERWNATSDQHQVIPVGTAVEVIQVDGLRLTVRARAEETA